MVEAPERFLRQCFGFSSVFSSLSLGLLQNSWGNPFGLGGSELPDVLFEEK